MPQDKQTWRLPESWQYWYQPTIPSPPPPSHSSCLDCPSASTASSSSSQWGSRSPQGLGLELFWCWTSQSPLILDYPLVRMRSLEIGLERTMREKGHAGRSLHVKEISRLRHPKSMILASEDKSQKINVIQAHYNTATSIITRKQSISLYSSLVVGVVGVGHPAPVFFTS